MGGAADLPQRSSSPLKRTAESMESDEPTHDATQDVPMNNSVEESSAEQPRGHVRAVSVDMLAENTSRDEIPSIDEQIETITKLVTEEAQKNYNEGDKVYLVSLKWLNRVQARASKAKPSADVDKEGEIGPIDNSDITREVLKDVDGNEFVRLNEGTGEESFAIFPEEAWTLVNSWYGLPQDAPPITRTAHNTNSDLNGLPNVQIEFHPLVLKLHRLWSRVCPIPLPAELKANDPPAPIIVVPKSANYREVLKKIKGILAIEMENKVRLWRIDISQKSDDADAPPTPVSQGETQSEPLADAFYKLLVEVPAFLALDVGTQREKMPVEARDTTIDSQATSKQTAGVAFSGTDTVALLDEEVSGTSDFVSTYSTATANKAPITLKLKSTEPKQLSDESGRSSPARSGPVTRGRSRKTGKTLGCVGLTNLGNTCYMNSALQCVRSVEELTKFFLTGEWSNELNVDNPLGNNGEVASSYARLLDDFYRDGASVVRPSQFKSTIGRYAPSFSGYGQQDSQEFLGFLLDGLQEDLSRIKKKPYIEKPDSTDEMVNNPAAIRDMAAKVWDITKKRDDSVIADLFTGMYKSTLVCPVCAKVSITFDPFNNLTLQLPIENTWNHTVRYFPLNDYPVQIDVDMDKNGTIKALKTFVGKRVNVPVARLMVAEEWKQKLYKVFDDFMVVSEENIQKSDVINVYELEDAPTNYPPTKKPRKQQRSMLNISDDDDEVPTWDSPAAQKMLVPVHHRVGSAQYKQQWKTALIPHLILLTPEEAKSEDAIRRKILEKVATLTTHPEFHENEESDGTVDHDGVIMSGSDSSEDKVVAKSIDGEDDVVDVTMNDSDAVRESTEKSDGSEVAIPQNNSIIRSRRPKFVDSKEYLQPIMQNLFTISYHASTKKTLPVGYDTVKDDYTYPLISTRAPHPITEDDEESHEGSSSSETHVLSADGEDGSAETAPTRMTEESDSEDELAKDDVPVRPVGKKHFVGKGRRFSKKTYSAKDRKAAKAAKSSDTISESGVDAYDGGPLVRPGEGLIIDWSHDAFTTLFDGTTGDSMRGQYTLLNPPLLPDPELAAKRDKRSLRRRQGITLDDCLDEFGKEEILSEMDTWYCPRCKEHRRASKKFELWKTPDILVMHLKRFSSSTTRRDKLDVLVDFPIEGLDLSSRVIENQEGKKEIYDLFAVDDHWGGLGGGHYTAHAKSFFDGQWYEYNDSSVSKKTDLGRIVTPGAYLLFYRRRSDKPLGGPRLQEIVERYDNPDAENSDSGEAQRLDADSSLRGSSSALQRETAVEEPHPHPLDGLGGPLTKTNTNHSIIYEDEVMDDTDDHPAEILDPSKPFSLIDQQQWNFNNITSQNIGEGQVPRSEASSFDASVRGSLDDRSDIVDDNSSAGTEERMQRFQDFNDSMPDDFEEQSIVPDLTEEQQYAAIGLEDIQHLAPRPGGEDEEVKEIHVEEGEGVVEK